MSRALAICGGTALLCTILGAAIYVVPHRDDPPVHSDSKNCMTVDVVDGLPGALGGGIVFGGAGYLVSLVLGPTLVAADTHVRKNRMEFDFLQWQARNNAQSLLRGSSVPTSLQKAELLRAAQSGSTTPPRELLRSVPSEEA
jgi:hypothetical protein